MKRVQKLLDITFDGLTKRDYDSVIGVFGDEGVGKSTFLLHIIEYWVTKKYNCIKPEDIKYIDLDINKWAEQLSNSQKFDISILDEGGKLSNKRSMSNLNLAVNQAYQIIRGDNLLSILALPSAFDLDGFFTKRRMRGAFLVYERGKVAYWSRKRLRKIIELNQNRMIKSMWVVKPTFNDTFPKYDGILREAYLDKKREFMKDTRKELAQTIKKITGEQDDETKQIIDFRKKGKTFNEIADEVGCHRTTISRRLKRQMSQSAE